MEELRFALLIFGGCAIIAILAHGLWSLRKNTKSTEKQRVEPVSYKADPEGFDEFGIGEVRVVNNQAGEREADDTDIQSSDFSDEDFDDIDDEQGAEEVNKDSQADIESVEILNADGEISSDDSAHAEQEKEPEPEPIKLYGSVVSNPKPTITAQKATKPSSSSLSEPAGNDVPEPPSFLLHTGVDGTETDNVDQQSEGPKSEPNGHKSEVESFSLDQAPGSAPIKEHADQADEEPSVIQSKRGIGRKRSRPIQRKRVEPSLGEDQMKIDFDTSHQSIDTPIDESSAPVSQSSEETRSPEQEVLVLNVRAPNEQEISGAALLPMLLTLGFKFGDQDIFHRHVNSNGKGPVLFSLANMFKPGVFDIDNLENFTTQGVSLFMILPIEGDPHQVFNMMHNAARKLAEEFSCQILDGRRSVLTKQGLQQYVEKIREFERQRMIARS